MQVSIPQSPLIEKMHAKAQSLFSQGYRPVAIAVNVFAVHTPNDDRYIVSKRGKTAYCDCKAFSIHGVCKHSLGIDQLVADTTAAYGVACRRFNLREYRAGYEAMGGKCQAFHDAHWNLMSADPASGFTFDYAPYVPELELFLTEKKAMAA
jgi:hypothetical protein